MKTTDFALTEASFEEKQTEGQDSQVVVSITIKVIANQTPQFRQLKVEDWCVLNHFDRSSLSISSDEKPGNKNGKKAKK